MANISEISRQLNSRAEEIARRLLPNGRRDGHEWRAGSIGGEKGDSLGVHLSGDKAGVWSDFAAGKSGADLLDLWAAVKGIGLSEALREAKSYLGIVEPSFVGPVKKEYRKPERPALAKRLESGSDVMEYLTGERRISAATLAAYQVAEGDDANGPCIVFPFKCDTGETDNGNPGLSLVNIKYLSLNRNENGKKITRFESGCMMTLFGWQAIPETAREVVICEGEMDALSWFESGVPALSVPNGAKSFTWLENEFEALERFEVIYLSWDMDADGRAGVAEAIDRLGRQRCRVVGLPFKDANECLQNGVSAEQMHGFVGDAQSCDPAELKRASVFVDEVIDEFYPSGGVEPGFASPWPKLDKLIWFRPGEFSLWSGFNKSGKTTMLNHVMLSGMSQRERICIASLEIKPRKLLKRMTRQSTAERQPKVETIRDAHIWYDGKLWMFDLVGKAKTERLFEVFEYARQRYGITQFVIDSLMRCGIAKDDYNAQADFGDACAEFSTSHNVNVHLVAHSNKSGRDREFSRLDVRGAGELADLAHNIYAVAKNEKKEKAIELCITTHQNIPQQTLDEPDAYLICDGTRDGEWTGRAGLWFEPDSLQYLETPNARPLLYISPDESGAQYDSARETLVF
jgi:twinkle protein